MRLIKIIILFLGDIFGLNILFKKINSDKVRILNYHGLTSTKLSAPRWTVLSSEAFEWQMDFIKKYYNNILASELFNKNANEMKVEANRLVISFDDGYENTLTIAQPIMKKFNLKGICFVLPGLSLENELTWTDFLYRVLSNQENSNIDLEVFGIKLTNHELNQTISHEQAIQIIHEMKSWSKQRRDKLVLYLRTIYSKEPLTGDLDKLMTIDQIKTLNMSGFFEIGLHSNSHQILSSLNPSEQDDEVFLSAQILKDYNINFVPLFAYPNGRLVDFNENTIASLKKHEIEAGLTTIDNLFKNSDNRYFVPRIQIGSDISKVEFKARLSGFYYFLQNLYN
jgi:peptidoglycan/xylan/chitin deacetylase (PgdA/CDA1 family)